MGNVAGFEKKRNHADGLTGMLVYVIPEIAYPEEQRNGENQPERSDCRAKAALHVFILQILGTRRTTDWTRAENSGRIASRSQPLSLQTKVAMLQYTSGDEG